MINLLKLFRGVLSFLLGLAVCYGVSAQQCDCREVMGSCNGAIEFLKAYGSPPSYGAEFVVHSSEGTCSKVEYLIKNTPQMTILANKRKETESTFGTSPITSTDIAYSRCSICKNTTLSNAGTITEAASAVSPFVGVWVATDRNLFGATNQSSYNISVEGSILSGTLTDAQGQRAVKGTVTGSEANITCSNCFSLIFRLINPTTIEYSYPFGKGTLRKQ